MIFNGFFYFRNLKLMRHCTKWGNPNPELCGKRAFTMTLSLFHTLRIVFGLFWETGPGSTGINNQAYLNYICSHIWTAAHLSLLCLYLHVFAMNHLNCALLVLICKYISHFLFCNFCYSSEMEEIRNISVSLIAFSGCITSVILLWQERRAQNNGKIG